MNEFTKEQLEQREIWEKTLYDTYEASFQELFKSCMYKLPEATEVAITAFLISKPELIVKACRSVLEKYEEAIYNTPNPDQLKMKLEEDK